MKVIAPDYYTRFSCLAGKCRHSCCVGWEIDVDDEAFEYYSTAGGELGERLMSSIAYKDGSRCFIRSDNERCPFLNENNLCEIIIKLGADKLCQICADHPRYRSFFSDHTEIGLGLCCEAAAELILTKKEKTQLIVLSDDNIDCQYDTEDADFLALRRHLFNIVQNRNKTIKERISEMFSEFNMNFIQKTPSEWADIYLALERLDPCWTEELNRLKSMPHIPRGIFMSDEWETAFEQLLVYFIFRHLPDSLYDGKFTERLAFAVYGLYMICLLCASKYLSAENADISDFINTARMYSSEIEYCEENIYTLLNVFKDSCYE